MSLRFRVVLFTLAVLLPACVFGTWILVSNIAHERASIESSVHETTRALALVIDGEMQRRATLVQALAASQVLQDWDLQRFCQEARKASGVKGPIALMDRSRAYLNTNVPECLLPPDLQSVIPVVFTEDKVQLSDLFTGAVTGQQLMTLAAPVQIRGKLYNVMMGILPSEVQALLERQKLPAGWHIAVVNHQGRVIARVPEPEKWVGQMGINYADPSVRAQNQANLVAPGGDGHFDGMIAGGVQTRIFFSTEPLFSITLFASVPLNLLEAVPRTALLQASLLSAALLLFGILIAVWIGRAIVRPVMVLEAAAQDLQNGHRVSVPPTGISEFERIGRALERAGSRIRTSNLALEQRVSEAVAQTKAAQSRLVQSQKLEAIGKLTGGIAHDFNNLLQTLSTGLHVLEQSAQDPKARQLIDAGLRAVNRAARMVQQLLAFGRHTTLARQPLDLRNQLLSMEALLSKALPANVSLRLDLAPDLWLIDTDQSQLEMALLNLVFNARDAVSADGTITIRACNEPDAAGDMVAIDVVDSGTGIDADTLSQIFDPFFTTKPVGQGTGLGLAQVRSFAEASGGSATARSTPGRGTTVTLRLPRALRLAPQDELGIDPTVLRRNCRVLFVEDDMLIADVVTSALTGAGFNVTRAQSGDEALAILRSGAAIDVVFSDVVMPGAVSGVTLARTVASQFPHIPVVLATGYSTQAREVGDLPLLAKPYSVQSLIRALVEALPRHG